MKRMKPEAYKFEAEMWVKKLTKLLPFYGEWNLKKIMEEVERILRRERNDRTRRRG